MVDKSRFVVRWSSNYDFIGALINSKTKHVIYKWSQLPQKLITLIKVKSVRTIASFDSKINDLSVQLMSEINYFKD